MLNISQNYSIEQNDTIIPSDNSENIKYIKHFIQPYFHLIMAKKKNKFYLQKKKNRKLKTINNSNSSNGRWSKEEHNKFIEAIIKFGNDWKKIQKYIPSRTSTQARSHAQKFLMKFRNSTFFKQNNIDSNLSWAKTIQFIKNKFSNEELEIVLKNIHCNIYNNEEKKNSFKKINSDYTNFNSDDSITIFSNFNNNNFISCDYNKENELHFLYSLNEENENIKNYENNHDYIQSFIQNFNRKYSYINDFDFTINDINNIYYDHNNNLLQNYNKFEKTL